MVLGLGFRHFTKLTCFVRFSNLCARTKSHSFVTMSNVKIGTHNGSFHCDEALACFMLKLLPQYKDAVIVRSRDLNILNTCDIVVDVGGIYDPSKHRYDHHMRDFNESVSTVIKKPGYQWTMKLSSAGLIYCHFGHEIIRHVVPGIKEEDVDTVFKRVYNTLIQEVDAVDNGVPMYKEEPLYRIVTSLSSRVGFLNPTWNSKGVNADDQFLKAVQLTGDEFMQFIDNTVHAWLPARSIVQESVMKRFEIDSSGEIIELSQPLPWSEHFFSLEQELNVQPPIKYVIYKDSGYHVQAVPIKHGSFVTRLALPESWAGLRDEELVKACGIEGAIFVHTVRFVGGNKTREGALMMARKSLEIGKSS